MSNTIEQKIEALVPGVSSLEHWKESEHSGTRHESGEPTGGKEYYGEFCSPNEIAELKALAARLAAAEQENERLRERLDRHEKVCKCGHDRDDHDLQYNACNADCEEGEDWSCMCEGFKSLAALAAAPTADPTKEETKYPPCDHSDYSVVADEDGERNWCNDCQFEWRD